MSVTCLVRHPLTYLLQRSSTLQAASVLSFRPRECEMGGQEGQGEPESQPFLCWILLRW